MPALDNDNALQDFLLIENTAIKAIHTHQKFIF